MKNLSTLPKLGLDIFFGNIFKLSGEMSTNGSDEVGIIFAKGVGISLIIVAIGVAIGVAVGVAVGVASYLFSA